MELLSPKIKDADSWQLKRLMGQQRRKSRQRFNKKIESSLRRLKINDMVPVD